MRNMLDVRSGGRALDGATLGRSLYEHVVHLAWLALIHHLHVSKSGARTT